MVNWYSYWTVATVHNCYITRFFKKHKTTTIKVEKLYKYFWSIDINFIHTLSYYFPHSSLTLHFNKYTHTYISHRGIPQKNFICIFYQSQNFRHSSAAIIKFLILFIILRLLFDFFNTKMHNLSLHSRHYQNRLVKNYYY